jgi:hypothetical protein
MSLNKLEDDLNCLVNGRRPKFLGKWKTISIFVLYRRRAQIVGKWKTTSIICKWKTTPNF